ncbi:acidic mammalian chitinase-like [Physella acuta]|uniref:acidic mammalian chitinase-like n=1 Tax=Physella acuta TaxID=109671 RepID=UPI0027DB076E|nr:acidic mammalian chitinase-like [Physella acuta]
METKRILLMLALMLQSLTQAVGKNMLVPSPGKNIFCYYSSFSQTRHGLGKFVPENINPHLCTHVIFAFVDVTSDGRGLRPFNRNDQGPKGLYARTLALKEKNPTLKVLLAVGGWQIGSKPFVPLVKDETTRDTWVKNVVRYLRSHGFDGIDIDWQFPATRGSPADDKQKFTLLLKGLYEAFKKDAKETGKEKLLLTIATASGTYYIEQSYEPYKIIHYIDFMLLMTYNYHGQWEKVTGHHSGLYPHRDDPKTGEKSQLYQEWSINFWLGTGLPKERLIVGVPTYGMSYTLANASHHGLHAPAVGAGKMGAFTKESGILSYYEICSSLQHKNWREEWVDDQVVPYAYSGDQWVGFENRKSVAFKAANIMKRELGGAFVWSVEMDDFRGICGQGQYPLLSTLVDALGRGVVSRPAAKERITSVTKPRPESTTSAATLRLDSSTPAAKHRPESVTPSNKPRQESSIPAPKPRSQSVTPTTKPRPESAIPTTKPRPESAIPQTKPRPNTPTPSSKPRLQTLTPAMRQDVCRKLGVGTFSDPLSCNHFIMCLPGPWKKKPHHVMACPGGTLFDPRLKICNYRHAVACAH